MFRLDADPHPNKVLRFQTINDRSESILAAVRAFRTNPDRAERQCKIVRNNDQFFDRPFLLLQEAADRFAAQVHVRLRFDQLDRLIFNFSSPN